MSDLNIQHLKKHLLLCNGEACLRRGGNEVTLAIRQELNNLDLADTIHTTRTRCNGRCGDACVVILYPEGVWYKGVAPDNVKEFINALVCKSNKENQFIHGVLGHHEKNDDVMLVD